MIFIKINNLFDGQEKGMADYKGLDINQFIAGSQVYDFENGVCLVKTRETDIPEHEDLQVLTEEEYETIKDVINSNSPAEKEKNEIERIEQKVDNAILELTTLISMGGM